MEVVSPVNVEIPDQFVVEISTATGEEKGDLKEGAFALFAKGKTAEEIAAKLIDAGWSPAFSHWYAGLVEAHRAPVDLVQKAPQAQPFVRAESLLKEPVCSQCGTRFDGKLKVNLLGFPTFRCGACGSLNLLPLAKYLVVYVVCFLIWGTLALIGAAKGIYDLPLLIALVSLIGILANVQISGKRRSDLVEMSRKGT